MARGRGGRRLRRLGGRPAPTATSISPTAAQAPETAAKWFAGRDDLVLVAVEADALGPALRWEPSRGGALFPHLYGALPLAAVVWARAAAARRRTGATFSGSSRA